MSLSLFNAGFNWFPLIGSLIGGNREPIEGGSFVAPPPHGCFGRFREPMGTNRNREPIELRLERTR